MVNVLSFLVLLRCVYFFIIIMSTIVGFVTTANAVEKTDAFVVLAIGFDKSVIEKLKSQIDSNDSTDNDIKPVTTINSANPEDLHIALQRINEIAAIIVSEEAWQATNDREKRLIIAFSLTGAIVLVCANPTLDTTASGALFFTSEPALDRALLIVETKLANAINFFNNPVVPNKESVKCTPIKGAVRGLYLVEVRPDLSTAAIVSSYLENEFLTREFNDHDLKHRFDLVRFLLNRNLVEPLNADATKQDSDSELAKAAVNVRNFELGRTIIAVIVSIISALFAIFSLCKEGTSLYRRFGAALISVVLLSGAIAILLPVSKQSYKISTTTVRQSEALKLAIITGKEKELVTRRSDKERFLETKFNHYIDAANIEFPITLVANIEASGDVIVKAKNDHKGVLTDVRIGFGAFSANFGKVEPNDEVVFRIPKVKPAKSNQDIIQSETQEEAVSLAVRRITRKRFGVPLSPHSKSLVYPVGDDNPPESALLFNYIAYENPWLTATLNDNLKIVRIEHIGTVSGS